jgi:DNA-binding CsgD family transcriptional regulator
MVIAPDSSRPTIDAWHRAYNERAVEQLVGLAHPDIEIAPSQPLLKQLPGTTFRGHEGVRTLAGWTFVNFPHVRVDTVSVRRLPGWTLAVTRYTYDSREPDGQRLVWALFDVGDGVIRRIRGFASEAEAEDAASTLTRREREVFELMARGKTAYEIAEILVLSPYTVRTHVQNAKARLGARTTPQALSMALQRGDIVP